MSYKHIKSYRQRTKERVIYVMGGKCAVCSYAKCNSALEAHHIEPSIKNFTISTNLNKAWKTISKELRKCTLVCSNCHREIHEGLITSPPSSFDLNRNNEVIEEINSIKKTTHNYCVDCETIIVREATRCVSCHGKNSRITDRPSRKELKQMIRAMSFVSIGKKYGVSCNAVRKWCLSENLPNKKRKINAISSKEWDKL